MGCSIHPYLLSKFDCHINVEVCSSTGAVKYLHKYIFKGQDCGILESEVVDEIKEYMEGRYIAAQEACWRMFGFETNSMSHNIVRLPVHLPDQQYVVFRPDDRVENVLERNEKTMLTEFFETNKKIRAALAAGGDPSENMLVTYDQMPVNYTWQPRDKTWKRRQRKWKVVARINVLPPTSDTFYLGTLLHHVVGPESFQDVRTFEGVIHPTFKAAAIARGLLQDDAEWDLCLQEAANIRMPRQIRRLFATILLSVK